MYIPKVYNKENLAETLAFIKRFSFGTVTSIIEGVPVATHLPFIVEKRGDDIPETLYFSDNSLIVKELSFIKLRMCTFVKAFK